MKVPFQVGVPVTGENFIDREEILREFQSSIVGLKEGIRQDFALISPRRMGKSSVLLTLGERLAKEFVVVYIDCSKVYPSTLLNFLRTYSEEIYFSYSKKMGLKLEERISKAIRGVGTAILEIIEKFGIEFADIKIWLEFRDGEIDTSELIEKVLDLPEKLAREKNYFLIILDEFQELERFGADFLKYLRAAMTRHKRTDYIIAGSEVSMMQKIVHDRNSPFYNLFIVKTLDNLPREDARRFLANKFKGFKYTLEAIETILDTTECHPFYLQWLARAVYLYTSEKKEVTERDVRDAFKSALREPSGHFEYEVARIKGRGRYFDILVVMAKYNLETPSKIGKELGLEAGEVSPYLKKLIEMGFLKKDGGYQFVDKILKEWIKATY
jgi:hypothetical protein